jgi:hypothetical protein
LHDSPVKIYTDWISKECTSNPKACLSTEKSVEEEPQRKKEIIGGLTNNGTVRSKCSFSSVQGLASKGLCLRLIPQMVQGCSQASKWNRDLG